MPSNTADIQGYIDYFRQLAVTHKDIQHNIASETGDASPGEKRFSTWGIDQVVTGLRTKMGDPLLLLENYEIHTSGQNMHDVKAAYSGAFTVIGRAKVNNYADEVFQFAKCERIYKDILQKIWQEMYGADAEFCSTPFYSFQFHTLSIIPVGPLFDNSFGWRIEFSFNPKLSFNISTPPEPGTFITAP